MVQMFNTLVQAGTINTGDVLVYLNLAKKPQAAETLAKKLTVSSRTVIRACQRLEKAGLVKSNSLTSVWKTTVAGSGTNLSITDRLTNSCSDTEFNNKNITSKNDPDNSVAVTPSQAAQGTDPALVDPGVMEAVKAAAERLQAQHSCQYIYDNAAQIVGEDAVLPDLFEEAAEITIAQVKERSERLHPVKNVAAFFLGTLRNLYRNQRNLTAIERLEVPETDNTKDTCQASEEVLEAKELIKREIISWGITILPRGWDKWVVKVLETSKKDEIDPKVYIDALTDKVMGNSMSYWATRLAHKPTKYLVEMINEFCVKRQTNHDLTVRYRRMAAAGIAG